MARGPEDFTPWAAGAAQRLLRAATAMCGDHHAAQDLVQDVLARVYVAWDRVGDPDAYARRALVNATTSRWRARARRPEVHLDDRVPLVDPGRAVEGVDDRHAVVAALALLPPRQRAAVVLRYLAGCTEAETARAMGTSVGTVKSQTSKALATLRTLVDEGGGPAGDPPVTGGRGRGPARGPARDGTVG